MNRDRLRALAHEPPACAAARVRLVWPEIRAALQAGHRLTAVCERLNECGVEVSYRQLTVYVSRLRRQEAMGKGPRLSP